MKGWERGICTVSVAWWKFWEDNLMDSFLTWEGIVATGALLISLYNLRRARRAPAAARQRELRDQLRTMLDDLDAQVKVIQSTILNGDASLPEALAFSSQAGRLLQLSARMDNSQASRVNLVVAALHSVAGSLSGAATARSLNSSRETLQRAGESTQSISKLQPVNEQMRLKDLDDACKDAAQAIAKEIRELNRLESR